MLPHQQLIVLLPTSRASSAGFVSNCFQPRVELKFAPPSNKTKPPPPPPSRKRVWKRGQSYESTFSFSHAVVASLCCSRSWWACRRQVNCCNTPISFKVDILCFFNRLASEEATSISSNAWPLFNKLFHAKKQRIQDLNVSFQVLDTSEIIQERPTTYSDRRLDLERINSCL